MKISAIELVNKFYDEVCKEKYPNFTRRQVVEICYSPFRYLRIAIARNELPTIRFCNLGKFTPHKYYVLGYLRRLDGLYNNNKITREHYEEKKDMFINYLKRLIKELDEDYKTKVENGGKYMVKEWKYNSTRANYIKHLEKYEAKVPVRENDLKK